MSYVKGIDILGLAHQEGYALGSFDMFNYDSMRAIVDAAEELGSPVFLQACARTTNHMGVESAGLLLKHTAEKATVPVAVHFDHGPETTLLSDIALCLKAGFKSVMVDGSRLPIAQNKALTKEAVRMARAYDANVEGEIGEIARITGGQADEVAIKMAESGDPKQWFTSPEEAAQFVEETGVDYLAVSVGSISGHSSSLDLSLLEDLIKALPVPLVLHGGTGIPPEDVRAAVKLGVAKINIAHGVRRVFLKSIRESLADGTNTDNPYLTLTEGRKAMKAYVSQKILQFRGELE
jgi:fructose-bisphosphate aldolase class II